MNTSSLQASGQYLSSTEFRLFQTRIVIEAHGANGRTQGSLALQTAQIDALLATRTHNFRGARKQWTGTRRFSSWPVRIHYFLVVS